MTGENEEGIAKSITPGTEEHVISMYKKMAYDRDVRTAADSEYDIGTMLEDGECVFRYGEPHCCLVIAIEKMNDVLEMGDKWCKIYGGIACLRGTAECMFNPDYKGPGAEKLSKMTHHISGEAALAFRYIKRISGEPLSQMKNKIKLNSTEVHDRCFTPVDEGQINNLIEYTAPNSEILKKLGYNDEEVEQYLMEWSLINEDLNVMGVDILDD